MFIESAGRRISTCRSAGPKGEAAERTRDYDIASRSLQGKIKDVEVVEDFESRPLKAVVFWVDREGNSGSASAGC